MKRTHLIVAMFAYLLFGVEKVMTNAKATEEHKKEAEKFLAENSSKNGVTKEVYARFMDLYYPSWTTSQAEGYAGKFFELADKAPKDGLVDTNEAAQAYDKALELDAQWLEDLGIPPRNE